MKYTSLILTSLPLFLYVSYSGADEITAQIIEGHVMTGPLFNGSMDKKPVAAWEKGREHFQITFNRSPILNSPYVPDSIAGLGIYEGPPNLDFLVLNSSLRSMMEADNYKHDKRYGLIDDSVLPIYVRQERPMEHIPYAGAFIETMGYTATATYQYVANTTSNLNISVSLKDV